MSLTTPQLIQKLPQSWWGLFGAMRLDHHHGDATETWYQSEAKSKYGGHSDWGELLAALTVKEPICYQNLTFKSRFVQLPSDIQCQFLRFVLRHREEIPLSELSDFCEDSQCHTDSESWQNVLLQMLATYIKVKQQESGLHLHQTPYRFTCGNQALAASFCERLKKSTQQCPWKKIPMKKIPEPDTQYQKMEICDDHPLLDRSHSPVQVCSIITPSVDSSLSVPGVDVITIVSDDDEESPVEMEVTELCTDPTEEEPIPRESNADTLLLAKGEKLKESWQSGSETSPEIDLFLVATPDQIQSVAAELKFCFLTDSEVLTASQSLTTLSSILSEAASVQFMASVVHPKIAALKQSASRQLLGVISLAAEHFPKSLIEGVFIRCLEQGLGSAQTDIFCKVIKTDLPDSARLQMVQKLTECTKPLDENIVYIYQTLIDTKVELSEVLITGILKTLHSHSSGMEKNLKYGKLLLAIINKYGHQFTNENINIMEKEVQKNGTFLKKALSAALNKLRK